LSNLKKLYLADNKIAVIRFSNNSAGFKNLEILNLVNNSLTEFPDFIFELSDLKKLYLADNKIAVIPPKIYKLNNLNTLYLSVNPILDIPEEISMLKNLKLLGIQITRIPQDKFAIIRTHVPGNCEVLYEVKERKPGYMFHFSDMNN
jgi:Leucine-rich repeat (LRR) protein